MLSLLWVFPSVGALCILGSGVREWPRLGDPADLLDALAFEQCVAVLLLFLHLLFLVLARRYRRAEPFQESVPYEKEG